MYKPVLITYFEGKFIIDNKEACPLTINSAADETSAEQFVLQGIKIPLHFVH